MAPPSAEPPLPPLPRGAESEVAEAVIEWDGATGKSTVEGEGKGEEREVRGRRLSSRVFMESSCRIGVCGEGVRRGSCPACASAWTLCAGRRRRVRSFCLAEDIVCRSMSWMRSKTPIGSVT